MNIMLAKLNYTFHTKPLLIGGKAMEYYGLRPAGADIDFVITPEDYTALAQQYPDQHKDLWGDLGVCMAEFELWRTICLFDYAYLAIGALDEGDYVVIALDKLLFLKTLAMKHDEKYQRDVELIVKKILDDQYAHWWSQLSQERQRHYTAQQQNAA
jgi:hypothetical protein